MDHTAFRETPEHILLETPGLLLILNHFAGLSTTHALAIASSHWNRRLKDELPVISMLHFLKVRNDDFWQALIKATPRQVQQQFSLCSRARNVFASIPDENSAVRSILAECVDHLQSATNVLLAQSIRSIQIAEGNLSHPGLCSSDLPVVAQRLKGDGGYPEQLVRDMHCRQEEVLPMLQTTTMTAGNVLEDCRLASRRGFDILKYDIYNRGVPKTPANVKEMAQDLIDAAGNTRRQFTSFVTEIALGLACDARLSQDPEASKESQTNLAFTLAEDARSQTELAQ
jgi:hypothetical protein